MPRVNLSKFRIFWRLFVFLSLTAAQGRFLQPVSVAAVGQFLRTLLVVLRHTEHKLSILSYYDSN